MVACMCRRRVMWRCVLCTSLCLLVALLGGVPARPALSDPETKGSNETTSLRVRLTSLEKSAQAINKDASKYPPEIFDINYPLLLLKIEKARLSLDSKSFYSSSTTRNAQVEIQEGEALVRLLEQRRPAYGNAAGYQERAYLSEADDSAQPYMIYIPHSYTSSSHHYPLTVFLHGYDTSLTKVDQWNLSDSVLSMADQRGYIVVTPYGRRNTDFVSIGEVDVLKVISEVKRWFRIDEDRVYLMGVSMGGYGAYAIGLHYPDVFGAMTVVAGRTDHYFWQKLDRDKVAPFKQWLIDADNPLTLVENARHLPILITQGEEDSLVDITHSHRMVAALKDLSYTHRFDPIPGENHWIYFGTQCYKSAFDWFDKYKRDPYPRLITHRTFSPKYGRAYWIEIKSLQEWGKPADLRAEAKPGNLVEINTHNVDALVVSCPKPLIEEGKPVAVQWNGSKVFEGLFDKPLVLQKTVGGGADTPRKNGGWGPIKEALNGPFMLVYGTGGDKIRLNNYAHRMAEDWLKFADGSPTIKADTAVSAEDIAGRNLVLFGDANQNRVVARMKGELPFAFKEGEYTISGHTYRGEDLGFMMTYPNPLNPKRYVVVQSGTFWGDALPINHKFDLLPDFIVYNEAVDPSDKTNQYVCAGFFDVNWKVDKSLIWKREK